MATITGMACAPRNGLIKRCNQMRHIWKFFLAYFRLDLAAVCEMSKGRDEYNDFHDYRDSVVGGPWYLTRHVCKRCSKLFRI